MTQSETNAQMAQDRVASGHHAIHQIGPEQLLPAVCPLCRAPGTTARPVPRVVGLQGPPSSSPLEAHYCDLCAQHLQDRTTRQLAAFSASTILSMTFVTAAALHWGARWLSIQLLVGLSATLFIPLLLRSFGLLPSSRTGIVEARSEGQTRRVVIDSQEFSNALTVVGIPPASDPALSPSAWKKQLPLLVLGLGSALFCTGWWATIHSLGNARIRVVHAGDQNATFLIDDLHEGTIIATNSEDPRAGRFVSVLGGRRGLRMILADGSTLLNESLTLWPGKTYIVGDIPTEKCLFWEERSYGEKADNPKWTPLRGNGPLWNVEGQVDSWFQPLIASEGESTGDTSLETSGGTRRAIRLLPCH